MRSSDFVVNSTNHLKWLSFPILGAYDFIQHGFIIKNRKFPQFHDGKQIKKILQKITSLERRVISPRQVHRDECMPLTSKDELKKRYKGDALLTNRTDIFISVQVADCVPIFLVEERKKVIGLIHAGWKGTLLGIAPRTIEEAKQQFGCKPEDFTILFGPCIRRCCYHVSDDVAILFDKGCVKPYEDGGLALDLICANRKQILSCGVEEERIFAIDGCTCCDNELFQSYRRERENAGRMIAFLGLK